MPKNQKTKCKSPATPVDAAPQSFEDDGGPPPRIETLAIAEITCDRDVQSRAVNEGTVITYQTDMMEGLEFSPIEAMQDGEGVYWLWDGWHRVEAARRARIETVRCRVQPGDKRAAILAAVAANVHGLPRTNADKLNAVLKLLHDDEWKQWSDREIARRCKVSHPFVAAQRAELIAANLPVTGNVSSEQPRTVNFITRHGSVASMNVRPANVPIQKTRAETLNLPPDSTDDEIDEYERRRDMFNKLVPAIEEEVRFAEKHTAADADEIDEADLQMIFNKVTIASELLSQFLSQLAARLEEQKREIERRTKVSLRVV